MNDHQMRFPQLEHQALKLNHHDIAVAAFLEASANLLESAVGQARQQDVAGVAGLMRAMQAGAMLTLRGTFALSTGLAEVAVEVIEPNGESHQLMRCELNRLVAQ